MARRAIDSAARRIERSLRALPFKLDWKDLFGVIDPRNLSPAELAQLLNSTPLGPVIDDRQIRRQRTRAGFRIGDGRSIDFYRYAAWLFHEKHHAVRPARGYEVVKEAARQRSADLSRSGRDIGELPAVVNPDRRRACERDYLLFCTTYFPETFYLPWSPDHRRVGVKIEGAVLAGGLFAMAMPRGDGKTSMCEAGGTWSICYGHRRFPFLVGSDEDSAKEMLDSIKMEFETNDLLLQDFPEVVYAIHALDGIAHRANGQLYMGERTHIIWTKKEVVLPTLRPQEDHWQRPECDGFLRPDGFTHASGAIIRVAGITGRIRGAKFKRRDGETARPDLVIVDDPQTDESARSPSQSHQREAVLAGAVLGLGGPGKKIAGFMPCTVVAKGDMADNILNREQHPEWLGERTKMVDAFPTNEKLWGQYEHIRAEELKAERGLKKATAFYVKHRKAMDAGARVAWEARFNSDEASALQHAMNLRYQDEHAFCAEYQNEPLDDVVEEGMLTADQIAAKTNGMQRRALPLYVSRLTAFIDVQEKCLYYVVAAWSDDFTGAVIDYGTYPDQARAYFSAREATRTLKRAKPGAGLEAAIYAGLEAAAAQILGKEWRRDDGALLRIERCMIDANWGQTTDVVYLFCRQSDHAAVLLPSHGKYVGASSTPFAEYKKKRGDRVGLNWRIPNVRGRRQVRHALYDTNYWKTFVHARLAVPMGDAGCLSLFGRKPEVHRMFADHLTAEYKVRTEGRGRTVDEWKSRPNRTENHWLDGLVGAAVAASISGCILPGTEDASRRRSQRPRMKLSEVQRQRRATARATR